MTSVLLGADAALMKQLFPSIPPIERLQHTLMQIVGVLGCCLAAAFLALWMAAPDYRVFRSPGIFHALVGVDQLCQYFGSTIENLDRFSARKP